MNDRVMLICPLCGQPLKGTEKSFVCKNHHSFDVARQGYLHLLPVQNKHSLSPGDAKEMLAARRRFLDTGKYRPICQSVCEAVRHYTSVPNPLLVDIGCGEGYYTAAFERECGADCVGIDIAKDGVRMSCARSKQAAWIVATASHIPVADHSVDVVTAMFSLLLQEEYARILKKGGCVVEVTVGSQHLIELKEIIYDEVFEQHKHPEKCGKHFIETECVRHTYTTVLNNAQLKDILLMTPHFWRIHQERRAMLEQTDRLELTVDYWVRVLRAV